MDLLEATGSNLTNGIIAGTRRCLATSPAATSRDRSPPCLLQHLPTRQIIGEAVSSEANLTVIASNSARQRWRQACCQTDSTCAEVRTLPRAPPAHRKLSRRVSAKISLSACGSPQHIQRPTPPPLRQNAPSLPGLGDADMARSRRRGVISAMRNFLHQISYNVTKPSRAQKEPCCGSRGDLERRWRSAYVADMRILVLRRLLIVLTGLAFLVGAAVQAMPPAEFMASACMGAARPPG